MSSSDPTLFGREEIVDRILRRALDLTAGYRQNLALLGPLRIGKSTILQHSVTVLQQHPPLLPVYLEPRAEATLREFTEQFAATLLYRYWATEGREPPKTLEALLPLCRPYLPRTTALLTTALAKARRGHASALRALFEAPGQLRQESGRLCVILVDEFHRLSAWERTDAFAALGHQITVQKDTMYVLASSSVDEARRILQERLALLFGQFEVVPVGPFDMVTSVRFLEARAGLGFLGMPALTMIADLVEGHPYALDQVARAVKAVTVPEGAPALERFCAALDAICGRPEGVLARQCQEAVERVPARRRAEGLPILMAVAEGHHRIPAMAQATGRRTQEVTRLLRVLVEAGLVVRRGVFSVIANHLLQFWLVTVQRSQQGPVQLDPRSASQAFAAAVQRVLAQATSRAPQAVLDTVAELLRRFQNELVEIHGRRVRLPKLGVHTLLLPGVPRAVVGQREGALWFCVPYTTVMRESDAVTLIQTLRTVAKPWGRRIVVALGGLDVNARLLLQEQRFWVWELDDLNALLSLYGLIRLLPTSWPALASVAAMPAGEVESAAQAAQEASA